MELADERTRRQAQKTAGRVFWVISCLAWAGIWAVVALFATRYGKHDALGHIVLWLFVAASLAAIALPVGTSRPGRQ